jgi:DNA polymerase-4
MRAVLCLLPARPVSAPARAVLWPPARVLDAFPALTHLETASDGRFYRTFHPAASWSTVVAQAHDFVAALGAANVPFAAGGLAAGHFPAACAATTATPGTLHILPPGTEATALAPLPLARLPDLSPHLLREFHQLRLFTLGDLAACPAPLLRAVFGADVVRLQALARGEDPGRGAARAPTDSALTATRSLLPGATPAETIVLLAALAADLVATLGAAGRAATALTVTASFAAGPPLHKTTRLPTPATDVPAIQTAAAPLVVALLRARRSRPIWVQLKAARSCDAVCQPPLPVPPTADPALRVQAVLADLHARFGPDVIQLGATRVPPSPLPRAARGDHAVAPTLQVAHALHSSAHP